MKAHCAAGASEHQRGLVGGNMMIYRKKLYGKGMPHGPVRPALPFHRLRMFGGDMDIDEFRRSNQVDEGPRMNDAIQKEEKITEQVAFIKTTPTAPVDEQKKMWEINNSKATNEPLRLKRQKPLKRDQNNLAAMLGLKKKG